eukprot:4383245-Prymnesium_polylepis.1
MRCIKIVYTRDGRFTTPDGRACEVERYPLWPSCKEEGERHHEYGVPLGMLIYWKFQLITALAFVVMFLVALPATADNYDRALLRNRCRAALQENRSLVLDSNASGWRASCGYAGLPIREDVIEALPVYLYPALTACE